LVVVRTTTGRETFRVTSVWLIRKQALPLRALFDRDGGQRLRTYPLPTLLADGLDGFTIVDVSIEPYDGNPEHSRNSEVRGTLPEEQMTWRE
jgi:hypothetical protein